MIKTFKILSLKKVKKIEQLEDVVLYVKYEVQAIKNNINVQYQGECKLSLPDKNTFSSFDSLTEQEVIGWVRSTINEEKLDELLSALIFKQEYTIEESPLPWEN
jgi:hypothetical protein